MKISLAWIFDYFKEDFQGVDAKKIVDLFNRKTAEIEHFDHYKLNLSSFFTVRFLDNSRVFCDELGEEYTIEPRENGVKNAYYLAKKEGKVLKWATLVDFNLEKDGLMPELHLSEEQSKGSWRSLVELEDYILDVDNKSINHRPDLWGHYGLAREIAATMGYSLKDFADGCAQQKIEQFDAKSKKSADTFDIEIKDSKNALDLLVYNVMKFIIKDQTFIWYSDLLNWGSAQSMQLLTLRIM